MAAVGRYIGEKIGKKIGEKVGDKVEDKIDEKKKRDKGGCGGSTNGVEEYKCSDGQCHATPETPKFKLEIEKNDVPENWWDRLPDIDPRVYDAISME